MYISACAFIINFIVYKTSSMYKDQTIIKDEFYIYEYRLEVKEVVLFSELHIFPLLFFFFFFFFSFFFITEDWISINFDGKSKNLVSICLMNYKVEVNILFGNRV